MSEELDVRIIKLDPVRVACVNGFGPEPEKIAWEKLMAYYKEKGLDHDGNQHRIFGYNNPNPAPGSPNYGYDFWVTVDHGAESEGDVRVFDFPGGLYAVTAVIGVENIVPMWQKFVAWREKSKYEYGGHQWLEEHIKVEDVDPGSFLLDLYMPIKE